MIITGLVCFACGGRADNQTQSETGFSGVWDILSEDEVVYCSGIKIELVNNPPTQFLLRLRELEGDQLEVSEVDRENIEVARCVRTYPVVGRTATLDEPQMCKYTYLSNATGKPLLFQGIEVTWQADTIEVSEDGKWLTQVGAYTRSDDCEGSVDWVYERYD